MLKDMERKSCGFARVDEVEGVADDVAAATRVHNVVKMWKRIVLWDLQGLYRHGRTAALNKYEEELAM
jgi:hypothetical protein